MNTNKKIIIVILVLIVVAFYGGMKYSQSKNPVVQSFQNANFTGGAGSARNLRGGAGGVSGDIIAKDATSVTVKMRDGGSKIVLVSPSASVIKTVSGSLDDLAVGKTINVVGMTNSDGSFTAESIQIRQATTK